MTRIRWIPFRSQATGLPRRPPGPDSKTRRRGPEHHRWKGDEAGYHAKHVWMLKREPKRGFCVACGLVGKTDWANLDHQYRRAREDWAELCRSCHKTHDAALRRTGSADAEGSSQTDWDALPLLGVHLSPRNAS